MPSIDGLGNTAAGSIFVPTSSTDPVTVAAALTALKLKPNSTLAITDTVENIQKNLDALQSVAGKITALTTTDVAQKLTVTAAQYTKDSGILAKWGAGSGNTVAVTGVKAAAAKTLINAGPSYVTSVSVSDTSANIQAKLDDLQTLAADGSLSQIVQTGASGTLKITAAQYAADQDALDKIKNHAYTLSITNATVSDTLGLGDDPALTANTKIKAIAVRDTTDAIEDNLDALQKVGLRLKSISQTDTDTIDITGSQYTQDSGAIGKIITSYHLAVINASAAQASLLSANQKVVTIGIADTAQNLSKKWSTLQRLADDLESIEVTDSTNAIKVTADQLALSETLLSKFTDDDDHTYNLSVSAVKAGSAKAVSNLDHVASLTVADSAANLVSNLDDLAAINDLDLLAGITLTGKSTTLSMAASRLQGDAAAATNAVLGKISGGNYSLAVTGVDMSSLNDLASNLHVVSMEVGGSSADIGSNLDTLYQLGKKVSSIQQSDTGEAIEVTQAKLESRSSVLAKIAGGYTVNVSGVTANKLLADAANVHVGKIKVADSGKNLLSHWNALRSVGETLDSVTKTDEGGITLSVSQYLAGLNDELIGKFDSELKFSVTGASVTQATDLGDDDAVEKIDITDDGSAITSNLSDLGDLLTAGKLNSITQLAPASALELHASQLDDAQDVLATIKGGKYTLAVDEVAVADAKTLLTSNTKIASMKVTGDSSGIADNLADLSSLGHKLLSIAQTDTDALTLTGTLFEQNKGALAKIDGGFHADLTDVAAAKAATLAANVSVNSLKISDTGAHIASAWETLGTLGTKITDIAQSDSAELQLTLKQWTSVQSLAEKFSTDLAVSVSGASVADVEDLSADDAVQHIQVADTASALSAALSDLASESKLTQLQVSDSAALEMDAATYAASSDLLGLVKNGAYTVTLSAVAVGDAATLGADSHVGSMEVTGSSSDISTHFSALAALSNLSSVALSDEGGTVSLTAAQILNGGDTLAKFSSSYQIAATGVAMADLADIRAVNEVASIAISDTAENVSENFDDLLSLGGSLANVHLTDTTPVLALTQQDWTSGADALSKIDGSYHVNLSQVVAGDAQTLAADSTISEISVADTSGDIANHWSSLIDLYDGGDGKLVGISLTDADPLTLTEEQQTDGADLIAALLADETIQTA